MREEPRRARAIAEGALIRLLANATLQKRDVDLSLAKEVLRDLIHDTPASITIEEIQRVVAEFYNLQEHLLRDKTRKPGWAPLPTATVITRMSAWAPLTL